MLDARRVGPETASGTAGAEGRYGVVVASIGAVGVCRSHSQGGRLVAGTMNLSVNFLTGAVLAIVAGGSNHHDADINQPTDRAAYRIVIVRINGRRAQAHIDHTNVVGRAVTQDPVERGQN